jgi:hypothetical protein
MKKNIYKIIIAFVCMGFFYNNLSAQCTPDPGITTTGVYPLSLPFGKVNQAYNQVIQFYIIKDTTVLVPVFGAVNATIDSFTIFKINGMPNGMSFGCNSSNCAIAGGKNGCGTFKGTPTQKGTFPLEVILKIRVTALGITQTIYDTIDNYVLLIESGVNVTNAIALNSADYKAYPNPVINGLVNLDVWNNSAKNFTVQMFNVQGKEVLNQVFELMVGYNKNTMNTAPLAKGIYLIKINHESHQFEQKIIIE